MSGFSALDAIDFLLAAIMIGVAGVWVYFLSYMAKSFRCSPRLDDAQKAQSPHPLVSVILPARNEERYIAKCLESLLGQDYDNLEIVVINDSSTDGTAGILSDYAHRDKRIVHVEARPKPPGWAGKNWACIEGYQQSRGELLLFTDADTVHSPASISLAVNRLLSDKLDALSAVPKLVCNDFWTRVTLPILSVFLHTRFSALRVNDPKTKTGYFFGSFYVISRRAYEQAGTHSAVRHELVEDGALGARVKEMGLALKMVRGERQVSAVWARDLPSLWHGLRRLMIPLYYQHRRNAVLMTVAVFFILFEPFIVLPYSAFAHFGLGLEPSAVILFALNLATVALILITSVAQCRYGIYEKPAYGLGAPLGGAMVSFGFFSALADAKKENAVNWRDRQYTVTEQQNPLH